jgi:hypothetical protein
MVFIPATAVPRHKKPTYLRVVAAYCPDKSNPRRVRFTIGGNQITFEDNISTKTANLGTVKRVLSSVLSMSGGRFMTGNLKDFYLGMPMDDYEDMRIPVTIIPPPSWPNITLLPSYTTATSSCKFVTACTGSHKLENLPMIG